MKTIYVATYFNYFNDERRRKNTLEFCSRYPWVVLLQGSYKESDILKVPNSLVWKVYKIGFIDYILINRYLKMLEGYEFNLVVVDSDLILSNDFKELMEKSLETYDFVSGFKYCYDLLNGKYVGLSKNIYCFGTGHCGYIYGYSYRLLKKCGYFPECYLIGGFDWDLYKCMKMKNSSVKFEKEMMKYRGWKYTYLNTTIINNVHRNGLLTDFNLYNNLTNDVIYDFMKKRIL